jgi:hypothetical protein
MRVAMRDRQASIDRVVCEIDDNGTTAGLMRDEQARQRVGQLQGKDRNALGGAEIRQRCERPVAKAEPRPLVLGDLLALPDRVGQRSR